jgi:plasmid stabilization system protein ParE
MIFRVETSATAERDAEEILQWLLEKGAGNAGRKWLHALNQAIASLGQFPLRCPLAPESARFTLEVRQLLYGKKPHVYRILLTVKGEVVYVLHIRHGRRRGLTEEEIHGIDM